MTGPKDIAIGVLALLVLGSGVMFAIQRSNISKLKAEVKTEQARVELASERIIKANAETDQCIAELEEQNNQIALVADLGARAQEAQLRADEYADRVVRAEAEVELLLHEQDQFEQMVADAPTCKVYEIALRSIAGEEFLMKWQILTLCLLACLACSTTDPEIPSVPDTEYEKVLSPQPCIIAITPLCAPDLEEFPPFDEEHPRDWAMAVRGVEKRNRARLIAAIAARDAQIAEHNALEPKCAPSH